MGAATREALVLVGQDRMDPVKTSKSLRAMFGRSLRLRQVSAGGLESAPLMGKNSSVGLRITWYIQFIADHSARTAIVSTTMRIASGANSEDYNWTEVMMRDASAQFDGIGVHYYTVPGNWEHKGAATGFDEDGWARTLAKTVKMDQGHHGANHPVKDLTTGKVEIVSMNHGFTVDRDSLPDAVTETHVSLFDGTNCGIAVKDKPIFSVQHHPEASPGPTDSLYLFDRFADLMGDR